MKIIYQKHKRLRFNLTGNIFMFVYKQFKYRFVIFKEKQKEGRCKADPEIDSSLLSQSPGNVGSALFRLMYFHHHEGYVLSVQHNYNMTAE